MDYIYIYIHIYIYIYIYIYIHLLISKIKKSENSSRLILLDGFWFVDSDLSNSLIRWLTVSSVCQPQVHLLSSPVLSIVLLFNWFSQQLFCSIIRTDLVSLMRFFFPSHDQHLRCNLPSLRLEVAIQCFFLPFLFSLFFLFFFFNLILLLAALNSLYMIF